MKKTLQILDKATVDLLVKLLVIIFLMLSCESKNTISNKSVLIDEELDKNKSSLELNKSSDTLNLNVLLNMENSYNFIITDFIPNKKKNNIFYNYHNLMKDNYKNMPKKYLYKPIFFSNVQGNLLGVYTYFSKGRTYQYRNALLEVITDNTVYWKDLFYSSGDSLGCYNYKYGLDKSKFLMANKIGLEDNFKVNSIFIYKHLLIILAQYESKRFVKYPVYILYLSKPVIQNSIDLFTYQPDELSNYLSKCNLNTKEKAIKILDSLKNNENFISYFL